MIFALGVTGAALGAVAVLMLIAQSYIHPALNLLVALVALGFLLTSAVMDRNAYVESCSRIGGDHVETIDGTRACWNTKTSTRLFP